jgi:polyferredoxin
LSKKQPNNSKKMASTTETHDAETYRDSLATVDKDGKRVWIYPKMPKGKFYNWRKIASYLYIVIFLTLPFIKVNGEPLFMLNVLERKFILFGLVFTPHDFHLFFFVMITFFVFIILFTVVFGRLFCGWACPQTVFLEMIFRRIEYWIEGDANEQRRLDQRPMDADKLKKRLLKHSLFFLISVVVANYFLAYIIGMDAVLKIISDPLSSHLVGFVVMVAFSLIFYGVFARLREQVCTTICPYGRLQGVLLVPDSIVVAYDFVRGEPRGKIQKQKEPLRKEPCKNGCPDCAECNATKNLLKNIEESVKNAAFTPPSVKTGLGIEDLGLKTANPHSSTLNPKSLGDCIDCKLCVQVCPTGIDIRNGTQLECVNCTACMDACDEVMIKVNRPTGLIRYDSQNGIKRGERQLLTTRVAAYSCVLVALLSLDIWLLAGRSDTETTILRSPGQLYQEVDATHLSNLYTFQVVNKTHADLPLTFKIKNSIGTIRFVGGSTPSVKKEKMADGAFFITLPKDKIKGLKTDVSVEIWSGDKLLETKNTSFVGPMQ